MAEFDGNGILSDVHKRKPRDRVIDVRGRDARDGPLEWNDFFWFYSDRMVLEPNPSIH